MITELKILLFKAAKSPMPIDLPKAMLLGLIALLVISFSVTTIPFSQLTQALDLVQKSPFDPVQHIKLVDLYIKSRAFHRAQQEYVLAQFLLNQMAADSQVILGDTTYIKRLENQLFVEPKTKLQQLTHWQMVTDKYPDYYSAWVQLVYLGLDLEKDLLVQKAWEHINQLDPNLRVALANELGLH